MTVAEPTSSAYAQPFWDATREGRFMLPYADGKAFWYPREISPSPSASGDVEWREASGDGTVYAVTVVHKPMPPRVAEDGPYAVALIELAEGPRMLSNVIGCPPDDVVVGMAVRLSWHALSDGRRLPMFTPA